MGIHQYLSQIRFLPAELAGELSLGALTAKEEELLCPSRLTASQSWHWGSPWALDKGRTQARPAARALGNWLPQFCILSSEKCRDSTLTGPWRAIGHRTCSFACMSVPSLPILHLPSGCLPLGDPQASQIQQGSASLRRKWQQQRPTARFRISLILLPLIPRSRSGSDGQELAGTSHEGSAPHSLG